MPRINDAMDEDDEDWRMKLYIVLTRISYSNRSFEGKKSYKLEPINPILKPRLISMSVKNW